MALPRELDPNATVAGQMKKIMDSGSPLLQRAKTNAAKAANNRGLLNSSMAVQAGEEAALSTALPIAQQDASTYAQRGAMDQQFRQQVGGGKYGSGLIGANLQAQQALQKGQQGFASSESALGRQQQKDILGTQQDFAGSQAALGRTQQKDILGQHHANAMESAQTAQDFQQANMQMQTDLQERLAVLGYEQNIGLSNLQNQFDLGKIDAQVFANTQGQYLQAVNELIRQTQISVGELQAAPDISGEDKSKMFADQGLLLQTHLGLYKNLYENAATWSQDWVDFPNAA